MLWYLYAGIADDNMACMHALISWEGCLGKCFSHSGTTEAAQSPLAGKRVVVLGAGGAGRALAFGAAEKGAHVIIANR